MRGEGGQMEKEKNEEKQQSEKRSTGLRGHEPNRLRITINAANEYMVQSNIAFGDSEGQNRNLRGGEKSGEIWGWNRQPNTKPVNYGDK